MTTEIDGVDYGPLAQLIGTWCGIRGVDTAPDAEANPDITKFSDELTFSIAGAAENAEEQNLVALRYRHLVKKLENGQIFHDQIGHWIFEPDTGIIMHSLTIPRGVCVLAGGKLEKNGNTTIFNVAAKQGDESYGVIQSPFMLEKATTTAFKMQLEVEGDSMKYMEVTSLHIYGKDFEHVDKSSLQRVTYDVD